MASVPRAKAPAGHRRGTAVFVPLVSLSHLDRAIEGLVKEYQSSGCRVNAPGWTPEATLKFVVKASAASGPAPRAGIDVLDALPEPLRGSLFPFQREGVRFAVARHGRCMIGDEMGLGKTVQAIAVSWHYRRDWPLLIVAPSSLRLSWRAELCRWLPGLDEDEVHVIMRGKDPLLGRDRNLTRVTVMSYDILTRFRAELKADPPPFGCVVCDESHYVKNFQAARTKALLPLLRRARRVLMLTGTPALSRPIELYTQINALQPRLFSTIYAFGKRYCRGRRGHWGWEFKGAENLQELHFILKKYIMVRRLKAQVLTQLKPKTRKAILVECKTAKRRRGAKLGGSSGHGANVLRALESLVSGGGGHGERDILALFREAGLAKVAAVQQHITVLLEAGVKFLVFAHHGQVLDAIEDTLRKARAGYFRIDGRTPPRARQQGVDRFQTDEKCRVALLSITAGGTGLTLTAASTVVFAELYWTPALLLQAEDRVHRIGQRSAVNINYVIGKGTVDETLWPMVCRKLEVLGEVLSGAKQGFDFDDAEHAAGWPGASKRRGPMERYLIRDGGEAAGSPTGKRQPRDCGQ